jgi:maltose/moltooligosaccharide transporter
MQSFFIGIGAVVASALPYMLTNWFSVPNTAPEGEIADSVRWSFYLGAAVFFLAVLWTVLKSKEYSPQELASFGENEDAAFEGEHLTAREFAANGKKQLIVGGIILLIGLVMFYWLTVSELDKQLYIFAGMISLAGLLAIGSGLLQMAGRYKNGFVTVVNDFQYMPKTMKQLALVQFFSWFALFAMWIYTTSAVTSHIYGTTDTTSVAYNDGADIVGVWFAAYNLVCFLVAFLIPVLARKTGRRMAHLICLWLGGLGLLSIYFLKDPMYGYISMIGVGIAWASILSVPYAMLAGSLPAAKMGYYMGVFNFFIVIPQLVAAAILGAIVGRVFNSEPIYALVIGGFSMMLAGLLSLLVDDKQ